MFTKASSATPRRIGASRFQADWNVCRRCACRPCRCHRVNWRAVRDLAGDLIGALSIFGTGYLLLLLAHGFGL